MQIFKKKKKKINIFFRHNILHEISKNGLASTLTLSLDDKDNWVLTGSVRCTDNVVYNLDLDWNVPTPTKTVKVSYETSASATYWPDMDNDLQLVNENDSYAAALDIYGVMPGETFDWANMDHYYTALIDYSYSMDKVQIGDAVNGKLEQVGDTTKISASLIGFNAVQYDVELWYVVPTPKDAVEMTIPVEFNNLMESEGVYQLFAYTADGSMVVSFSPYATEVAGTFVNDRMFGRFGAEGGRYDFMSDYTYVAFVTDPVEQLYDIYPVSKGQMVVTVDENDNITAKVDVICSDAVRYVLTLTSKYDIPHLEYDAEVPVEYTYTTSDVVEVTDYTADYGYVSFQAMAADGSNMTSIAFFVEEADADIVIPAGTYPIDYYEEYGTVLANSGVQSGYVYPSFFANMTEDGGLMAPLWFFVSGSVTIENKDGKLYLEVNGLNSYNQTIHITYDASKTSGVENVTTETSAKKVVKNGQLLIMRDGETFNVLGAQVK